MNVFKPSPKLLGGSHYYWSKRRYNSQASTGAGACGGYSYERVAGMASPEDEITGYGVFGVCRSAGIGVVASVDDKATLIVAEGC